MSTTIEEIEAQALALSPQERAELIERLIASVEPAPSLHPQWAAEIARRVAELDAGRSRFMPVDEALDRLAEHVRRRRPA